MKRCWFGLVLLLVLLAASVFSTCAMAAIHDQVERDLLQAADCALENDWHNAGRFLRRSREHWDRWEKFRACLADHTPVEEADAAFEAAQVYCLGKEPLAFAAACRSLARQTAAVGEAHEFVWWNLL